MESFRRFIGVDLGGGKGKKTALAVLEKNAAGVTVTCLAPRARERPLYDEALVDALMKRAEDALICIDAPLSLPPCLRCAEPTCPGQKACVDGEVVAMQALTNRGALDDGVPQGRDLRRGKPAITPYTQRAADLELKARGISPRETLGQGMGPLTARAAHLVRALSPRFRLNQNLIEVFPRATLELLGFRDPYKKRADRRIEILAELGELTFGPGVWREQCRQSDHMFDAVVCAYTGYLAAREGWRCPAAADDPIDPRGWIWVPPEPATVAANGQTRGGSEEATAERLRSR